MLKATGLPNLVLHASSLLIRLSRNVLLHSNTYETVTRALFRMYFYINSATFS